jgi:hypothetical protein
MVRSRWFAASAPRRASSLPGSLLRRRGELLPCLVRYFGAAASFFASAYALANTI